MLATMEKVEKVDPTIPKEIKRRHMHLVEEIGSGQFGKVWKARLDQAYTGVIGGVPVAAKILTDETADACSELFSEAAIAAQLGDHPHVVGLMGVVTVGNPIMMLVPYCENGSLLDQLEQRDQRSDPFNTNAKLVFGFQICKGMQHLHSMHFVHRDLAARNVLIDDLWNARVADFGLSRETKGDGGEYYRSNNGLFPVRWTSPEAMETQVFNEASDMWSFGVVMAEIFQNGGTPYGAATALEEVIFLVRRGERMKQEGKGVPSATLSFIIRWFPLHIA